MFSSDIEDAYQVAIVMSGIEDDAEEPEFRKLWEKALSRAKEITIGFSEAEKISRSFHGRKVKSEYLHNTVILGRTKSNRLVALDGNHRLIRHIEMETKSIKCLIIDISWIDDADNMDFDHA